MEGQQEDSNGDDTIMGNEEEVPQEGANDAKSTYKSYKKKYRKMKLKFDEAMRASNELYLDEQRAIKTAKRLAQQNDQIMDLLLDVNDSPQIPSDKRIDLMAETPALSPVPSLVGSEQLAQASELQTPTGQNTYNEIRRLLDKRASTTLPHPSWVPPRTLASLLATTPHLTSNNALDLPELLDSLKPEEGQAAPYHYLTPDQIDDYLYEVDSYIGTVLPVPRPTPQDSSQELAFGHCHSPYNWLRRKVPQIFLQDGESSEKSNGKPGALRGAGKRASIPAPSKPDALEIVEEDGIGYEFSLTSQLSATKKRKRDEEDVGYHPKKGAVDDGKTKKPRQVRKKKGSEGVEEKPASTRKKKVKAPSPPPGAHPFGDFKV